MKPIDIDFLKEKIDKETLDVIENIIKDQYNIYKLTINSFKLEKLKIQREIQKDTLARRKLVESRSKDKDDLAFYRKNILPILKRSVELIGEK